MIFSTGAPLGGELTAGGTLYPFRVIWQRFGRKILPFGLHVPRMEAYQGLLAAVTIALAGGLVYSGTRVSPWWIVIGLAAVAAIAERGRVKLARNIEASISLIPTVFTAATLG